MQKIFNVIFPIIAVAAGIAVIVFGVGKMNSKRQYDASTVGVIVGIEREWTGTDGDGFDEYEYTVYVDYEIDGKKYENVKYPSYDSSMKKGDEVRILYQSANPENIAEGNLTGNAAVMIVMGAAFTLIGLFMGLKAIVKR